MKRSKVRTITYAIAHAAAWDEGNRHMKEGGRTAWSEEDWNAAASLFRQLMPYIKDIVHEVPR